MSKKKIEEQLKSLNPEFLSLKEYIFENIDRLSKLVDKREELFSNKHTVLITYADQFQSKEESHLKSLDKFLNQDLKGIVSHVHLLPFYPWTSDDGFSPINYHEVCSDYGTWSDIKAIKQEKMFDCVFNHISKENDFFKKALEGSEKHQKMFHFYSEQQYQDKSFQNDIQQVVRPRTHPLFTKFKCQNEDKYVWTTFSDDQVDTNLANKDMLKYILESFFLYIEQGATFFRIDAVPFMWKELGTNCSHLPKTHLFVKLCRSIVDAIGANLLIITESNVPHHENITYWGNSDEAHVIYNFSLAPLILHGLFFKTNKYLHQWASEVFHIPKSTTYLNFSATHDGMGMRGLEGIVPFSDVELLCNHAVMQDGLVGKKRSRDGSTKPYELNCTWASFLKDPEIDSDTYKRKVINSHAVVMFFPGIAAHYVHNFFGSENWIQGLDESGIPRRLNRKKLEYPLDLNEFEEDVKNGLLELIELKNNMICFHPNASIEVVSLDPEVLSFYREYKNSKVLVLFSLSSKQKSIDCPSGQVLLDAYDLKLIDV